MAAYLQFMGDTDRALSGQWEIARSVCVVDPQLRWLITQAKICAYNLLNQHWQKSLLAKPSMS